VPALAPAPASAPAAARMPAPAVVLAPKHLSSSPIAHQSEDKEVIEDYWNWKTLNTRNISRRATLALARQLIDQEMWTINHLKLMSDTSSNAYKNAVAKGLPSGLAAGFRDDFRAFKEVYRTQYRPGRFLMELRQRQAQQDEEIEPGGFIRDE
jgi:hypothetical protein